MPVGGKGLCMLVGLQELLPLQQAGRRWHLDVQQQ